MGTAPSLEKAALETMDDEHLITTVHQAYQQDAARVDRVLAAAKMRHLQSTASNDGAASVLPVVTQPSASASAPTTATMMPQAEPLSQPIVTVAVTVDASDNNGGVDHSSSAAGVPSTDRVAALWTFQGHTLRQLRSGLTTKKRGLPGADMALETPHADVDAVDADGFPVLYGSCGREKKYARCSVCYFRGVRCNTAHYCACCQRPVCVRPRKYPGEEHPKICWNVLHVDADMIQRVDKRRARKLHAAATVSTDKPVEGSDNDEEETTLMAEADKSGGTDDVDPKRQKVMDGKTPSPSTSPRPSRSPSLLLAQDVVATATKSIDTTV